METVSLGYVKGKEKWGSKGRGGEDFATHASVRVPASHMCDTLFNTQQVTSCALKIHYKNKQECTKLIGIATDGPGASANIASAG